MSDSEFNAMKNIHEALSSLKDNEARERVLKWTSSKFGLSSALLDSQDNPQPGGSPPSGSPETNIGEIPGIAFLGDNGQLIITARDLKANSKIDAGIRLVHVAIRANELLNKEKYASSRKTVTPILREWGVYDGNTRREVANHKGIIRQKDNLSLDVHSKREADKIIKEILDDSIKGKWKMRYKVKQKNQEKNGK